MFFSSVHADDDLKRYPAAIQKAIEYAKNTDFSALEDGRQEIDGDEMYANLFHLTSKQKEEAHPELHKKYVDVQYWICGEELCGVAPYNGVGKCIETREDDDLYLYDDVKNEFFIHATEGCYAVFFPNDAHRPGVCVEASRSITARWSSKAKRRPAVSGGKTDENRSSGRRRDGRALRRSILAGKTM